MTPFDSLSDNDWNLIKGCLNAAVRGPFLSEREFHALFGLTRSEVAAVLERWPALPSEIPLGYESAAEFQAVAVNNVLNNLLGFPHGFNGADFVREVGASEPEVAATLNRLRSDPHFDSGGKGYFDRMMRER